eukprot:TRINITY_DN252_c0_g1_i1.p1 TRINITY_DN252_c0_g1~~TRINITY_DN252_c0_g1_i1.p1  ORF type:complete len:272 (-),score=36.39 TRINITY_DN252_c0_g1_i1:12-827(-)
MNYYLSDIKTSVVNGWSHWVAYGGALRSWSYSSVVSSPVLASEFSPERTHFGLSSLGRRGDEAGAEWNRVKEMAEEGQWGEVARCTAELVERYPEHPKAAKAWFKRGFALEMMNKDQEALECFSKSASIQKDPVLAGMAHFAIGNTLRKVGRHSESLEAYRSALELHPTPKVFCNLANLLQDLGHHQEALHYLDEALRRDRAAREVHLLRGVSLTQLRQFRAALWSFERARLAQWGKEDKHIAYWRTICQQMYKQETQNQRNTNNLLNFLF